MKQKLVQLKLLKLYYLFILILTIILVVPPHLFSPPLFMPLRFPHYLESMTPIVGISWPFSFEIYHWILVALTITVSINVLGVTFSKARSIAKVSSFLGLFLIIAILLFLLFYFMKVSASTAIIYCIYFIFLLIADLLTFFVLTKKTKLI